MPRIHLAALRREDAAALLRFELDNRAFFEANINARPADFYSASGVEASIDDAIREAREDRAYRFLIRDEADEIVGRVNLTQVQRAHFHSAELGYRIGEAHCGKGYASEAVRLVLARAFDELGLIRVEAIARPENEGSVRVLLRNGFTQYGRTSRSFELGGQWYDRLHFERRCDR